MTIALGVALVIAVIGLVGQAVWAPRSQAKHAREAWHRDNRLSVYRDASAHLQLETVYLRKITDEQYADEHRYTVGTSEPLRATDNITASMRLLAPDDVVTAWVAFTDAAEVLRWNLYEGDLGASGHPLPDDTQEVVDVLATIDTLRDKMRADLRP